MLALSEVQPLFRQVPGQRDLLNKTVIGFSDPCLKRLLAYYYPGNIFELRHTVEYAVSLNRAARNGLGDLRACLTGNIAGPNVE